MYYFRVSFKNKDTAKKLGARWDAKKRLWFTSNITVCKRMHNAGFKQMEDSNQTHVENPISKTIEDSKQTHIENATRCQKCHDYKSVIPIYQNCKCMVCDDCRIKCKAVAHVFFCEYYGTQPAS